MSTVLTESTALTEVQTAADLLRELGVDATRVLVQPPPGAATEKDVIELHDRTNRLFELIDGVLVEKIMGFYEGRIAAVLIYYFESFLERFDLGFTLGADGMMRLTGRQVRIPDMSFVNWDRVANHEVPEEPIPNLVPNLAVEVLSEHNSRAEMERKRREYFAAGVELVWQIDPDARTCEVFTSPDASIVIDENGTVDGGTVLPGFELPLRKFFARVKRGMK